MKQIAHLMEADSGLVRLIARLWCRPLQRFSRTASVAMAACCAFLGGCRTTPADFSLRPEEKRPLYRVQVSDSDEAGLIKERIGIEIVRLQGADLIFVPKDGTLDALRQFGYVADRVEPKETFQRAIKVMRKGRETELLETGVRLLRREDKYWIVQGTVAQMELLKARKYRLLPPDREPRPRSIEVIVREEKDVQRVAEAGVDIYSAVKTKDAGIKINGGAFDYQIEILKTNQFQVTIIPEPKEEK